MQKQQAKKYIRKVLEAAFDLKAFGDLVRELVQKFEEKDDAYSGNLIPEAYRTHVSHYRRIGKYTDPTGEAMDILAVQVTQVAKLERTRTALRNFVVNRLKKFGDKQYALVAFYSKEDDGADWRLSFVKIDYEENRNRSGNINIRQTLSPARRYSFLVGENENAHTAQSQLLPLLVNDYARPLIAQEKSDDHSVESAFSVEKVTDKFFQEYKNLFFRIIENEKVAAELTRLGYDEKAKVKFVKKLLGQIVFLYFIQKKGWLGAAKNQKMGEGDKRYLQDKFILSYQNNKNYYSDFLRYLFYEGLAKEHKDQNTKYYFERLDCKVPFLNGGLFEADHDWKNQGIDLPDDIFRNMESLKGGDRGTGILDVFDRYNFTIKEDEPLEKEVAIDPEMLGKVFENMLDISERKSKGAYYTPREIVHYMCRQSLIYYLDQHINSYAASHQAIDTEQLNMFGKTTNKKGNFKLELQHNDIKIPLEDLEVFIRNGHLALENDSIVSGKGKQTDSYKYQLPESIYQHAESLDQALADIKICDPAIGSGAFPVGMLNEIVTARRALAHRLPQALSPYHLKRHAIQNSIYGVDLDASAIDIARLRLWLSMIVDEQDYENIEPLPNLDYKIVRGNSLVGFPENWESPAFDKIEQLKELFFDETEYDTKKELEHKINQEIQLRLSNSKDIFGYQVNFDFKLHFSEVWTKNGGFDIVIGNPPYIDIKGIEDKDFVKFLFSHYKTTKNRINLYSIFIEKGLQLCREKGALIFINPNSMLTNSSYVELRKLIVDKLNFVLKLPDRVFQKANVETIIIQIGKTATHTDVEGAYFKKDDTIDFDALKFMSFDRSIWLEDQQHRISIFNTPEQHAILKFIGKDRPQLRDSFDFSLGITPYDKYKGHTPEQIKSKAFHATSKIDDTYVPLISGKNIGRYKIQQNGTEEYLSYGDWLGAPRRREFFTSPRVIVRQIVSGRPPRIYAGYTKEELYYTQIGFSIIPKNSDSISPRVLCAYLNSDVLNFYHSRKFLDIEKNIFQKVLIENCKSFPIPPMTEDAAKIIETILDYIQFIENQHANIVFSFYDRLISAIFFELFFSEELKAVKKQMLPHLHDLRPLVCTMSDEEKQALIKGEFKRMYDVYHPIRNNMETLSSIEKIRIIKKSLR